MPRAEERGDVDEGRPCEHPDGGRADGLGQVPRPRVVADEQVGPRAVEGRVWRSRLPDSTIPVYLIEQADYFERDDPERDASWNCHAPISETTSRYCCPSTVQSMASRPGP